LREIRRLTQELGVNLAGVEEIIRLRRRLDTLQDQMEGRVGEVQQQLQQEITSYQRALEAPKDEDIEG
jgi:MerR family transcriptional regulator, heat shock protein HspR